MSHGDARPLDVLPFDHRGSFLADLFGLHEPLSPAQAAQVRAAKGVIYQGFLQAVASGGVPRAAAALLVDEEFGAEILADARARGLITACPVEKSGQEEFDFEYGADFAAHIEAVDPTFVKALVRYNPDGDPALNARQTERLRRLGAFLTGAGRPFMFELLIPAEPAQLSAVGGDHGRYDRELRPGLTVRAVEALQDAGVEPDVWKVEGLDTPADARRLVAAARRDGRDAVGCIVLGRGADAAQVEGWLRIAAGVPGFTGFAVGRSTFEEPLRAWLAGQLDEAAAAGQIAALYTHWARVFGEAKAGA